MTMQAPIRYSPDIETLQPDEAKTIAELNKTFDSINHTTSQDYQHAVRAVHAKAHAILEGVFTVEPGLPPELAQGMFAQPGDHKVYMRMSTNAGDILKDSISLPRGLAIKVLDVDGARLPDAEGTTQDFLMVNGNVFQTKTAEAFGRNLKLVAMTTDVAEGAKVALSAVLRVLNKALKAVGIKSAVISSLGGAPNVNSLGETFFSVTPFRYGDYIAKFSIKPVSPSLTELTGREIDASNDKYAIRHALQADMQSRDGVYEFRVQLCRDLDKQPVEDSTVEWKENEAPFQKVATIRVPRQDSWSGPQVQAVDEGMRFSVWTGLAAHRPLGNINRARKDTYRHSADFRASFNRCPIHEPQARFGDAAE